ncbi:MAG TPA: glutamate racemase [Mollicutes bacterium]|nr:glutamate racemase [Mollicutes bacterium]
MNIGVIDSGIGGLTVVKELTKLNVNIIYYGDNLNVPYGNKTEEEIYYLSKKMIDYLINKNVNLIIVACNTISSIINKYFTNYKVPIISIIDPVINYIKTNNINNTGLLATKFTINSNIYQKMLKEKLVYSEISPNLATIIDNNYNDKDIDNIIKKHLDNLTKHNIDYLILGCTHYYLVFDKFLKNNNKLKYINPSLEVVNYIKDKLISTSNPSLKIYTTGSINTYKSILSKLDINNYKLIKK